MTDAEKGRPAFDERAALAELERLREQIVRYRSQRVDAGVEFDRFVRSLKTGETRPDSPPTAATRADISPTTVRGDLEAPSPGPSPAPSLDREPAPAAPAARRQPVPRHVVLLGGALLLAATGGVLTWTLRRGGREPAAPDRIVAQPPATSERAATPAAPQPIAVSPYDAQIVTSRPVWIRVVADGQRVLERELPTQARVPFKATRSIVIRAGDAGALRLWIGGRDQGPLGADGVVVTRTFSVSGPSTR